MVLSHNMKLNIVDFSQIQSFVEEEEEVCSECSWSDKNYNSKFLSARMVRKEGSIRSNFYIRMNTTGSIVFYSRKMQEKVFQHFDNLPDNYQLYHIQVFVERPGFSKLQLISNKQQKVIAKLNQKVMIQVWLVITLFWHILK